MQLKLQPKQKPHQKKQFIKQDYKSVPLTPVHLDFCESLADQFNEMICNGQDFRTKGYELLQGCEAAIPVNNTIQFYSPENCIKNILFIAEKPGKDTLDLFKAMDTRVFFSPVPCMQSVAGMKLWFSEKKIIELK